MVKMQAPKDVTQISVEQQVFNVDDNGSIQVPDPFVDTLRDIGFRIIPGRITVSQEAADAIAAAAKKLNLPVPQELQIEKKAAEPKTGEQTSTEPAPAAPGATAPNGQAGAPGSEPTMSEKQMTEEKW